MEKGHTNNPNGRPKGIPNKVTQNMREWISALIDNNREQIEEDLKALEPKERVQMFERLMQYVVPKQQAVSADLQDLRARNRPLVERLAMLARGEEIPKDEE